jgi:hypothetical protein
LPLDEAYFVWLYSQVGSVLNRNRSKTYWKLLKLLHEKEFTWSDIEKDENRAQDGKDLRLEFMRSENVQIDSDEMRLGWTDLPSSFLELLIALSIKLSEQGGNRPADWFWEMIQNLGMTECTDAAPAEEVIISHILDKVMNRDYSPNGAGGLFPLQDMSKHQDQRDVELWYQAQAYLLERL